MASSAYEQHKLGAIDWLIYKKLITPTVAGVISGSLLANLLSGHALRWVFGIFLLTISISSFLKSKSESNWSHEKLHFQTLGFLVAVTVGLVGTGIITIPFLKKYGQPLKHAIAMSIALGCNYCELRYSNVHHHRLASNEITKVMHRLC